jgi:lipopolysaccharide export LptBFGC system permease protein LptF
MINVLCAGALIVVGIYLAEELVGLLHVLSHSGAGLAQLPKMLLLSAPQILDIAMPIAVLISVYRVVLELRESRELVVLSASRVGAQYILRVVAMFGVFATLLTLFVAGYVEPTARFTQRAERFEFFYSAVRSGLPTERFWHFSYNMVFARDRDRSGLSHNVFLYEHVPDGADNVVTAASSQLVGPTSDGSYNLRLRDFARYALQDEPAGSEAQSGALQSWEARQLIQQLSLDNYLGFADRADRREEWTLSELLTLTPPPRAIDGGHLREAVARILKALLCFLAPVLAIVAIALTRPITQIVALPFFCGSLLVTDFVLQFLFSKLPDFTFTTLAYLGAVAVILLSMAWAIAFAVSCSGYFLRPQLDQP